MADRSYGDACGVARALDVIGERWALLVIRELLLGPKLPVPAPLMERLRI